MTPFIIAAVLAASALIAIALWARHMGRRCATWPSTEGIITLSRLDDADMESARPQVRYEYTVAATKHVGWRIAYKSYGTSRKAMLALIAPHRLGDVVKVYYDPAAPERSVLDTRPSSDWLVWLCVGGVFLAFAAYLALR